MGPVDRDARNELLLRKRLRNFLDISAIDAKEGKSVTVPRQNVGMSLAHSEVAFIEEAAELLEKSNAGLEPELLTGVDAQGAR